MSSRDEEIQAWQAELGGPNHNEAREWLRKLGVIQKPSLPEALSQAAAAKVNAPSRAEAAGRNFAEGFLPGAHRLAEFFSVSPGAPPPMQRHADGTMAPGPVQLGGPKAQERTQRLAESTSAYPWTSAASGMAGATVGIPGMLGKGAWKATGAVPRLGAPAKSIPSMAGKGLARGVAAYEMTAPATAAVSDPADVGPVQAAKDAATNPVGLAAGGLLGMLGVAAQRHIARTTDPKTQSGRIIQDVKDAGGKINTFGDEPVRGGEFDKPAMQALPEGREGVNKAAGAAGRTFTRFNRVVLKKARKEYSKELEQIARDNPDPVDLEPVAARLDGLIKRQSNGQIANPDIAAAVQNVKRLITVDAEPGPQLFGPKGEPLQTGAPARAQATLQDLRQAKETVADLAQFGQPVTKDNAPYRVIYKTLSEASKDIDPRLRAIDEKFSATMSKLERANDIMYGRDTADVASRAASERTAAANFGRAGDPSQAGTIRADQLEELAALDPYYKRMLTQVRAKKAQESLRYGEEGANQMAIEQSQARGSGGFLGLVGLTPRNKQIAGIRMGLPAAGATQRAVPPMQGGPAYLPIMEALSIAAQNSLKRKQAGKRKVE